MPTLFSISQEQTLGICRANNSLCWNLLCSHQEKFTFLKIKRWETGLYFSLVLIIHTEPKDSTTLTVHPQIPQKKTLFFFKPTKQSLIIQWFFLLILQTFFQFSIKAMKSTEWEPCSTPVCDRAFPAALQGAEGSWEMGSRACQGEGNEHSPVWFCTWLCFGCPPLLLAVNAGKQS